MLTACHRACLGDLATTHSYGEWGSGAGLLDGAHYPGSPYSLQRRGDACYWAGEVGLPAPIVLHWQPCPVDDWLHMLLRFSISIAKQKRRCLLLVQCS